MRPGQRSDFWLWPREVTCDCDESSFQEVVVLEAPVVWIEARHGGAGGECGQLFLLWREAETLAVAGQGWEGISHMGDPQVRLSIRVNGTESGEREGLMMPERGMLIAGVKS